MPKKSMKTPPVNLPQSRQYNLFTTFFGDAAELSNTIELWDAIPKYSVSPRTQSALRKDGRLEPYEHSFVYATRRSGYRIEHACRVEIQPVFVKGVVVDKKTKETRNLDFYPSKDEELVEEVIRKIFADQDFGIHDPAHDESWIRFSLQMIRKELKARGKSRSLDEIKRSIEILSKSHISLFLDDSGDPVYAGNILSDLTRVTLKKYREDSSLTWIARLPALISKSINELTYRQFNYGVLMALETQLARWLHKRLSHNYTNASVVNPYDILLSTIEHNSGLLSFTRTINKKDKKTGVVTQRIVPYTSRKICTLEGAFDELAENGVIWEKGGWERLEERREGRKLVDILYRLKAHPDFVSEVKAANARLKAAKTGRNRIAHSPVGKPRSPGR
jgi:hypothetical protein